MVKNVTLNNKFDVKAWTPNVELIFITSKPIVSERWAAYPARRMFFKKYLYNLFRQ